MRRIPVAAGARASELGVRAFRELGHGAGQSRSDYKFFWGGFERQGADAGGACGIFSGQFELGGKHHAAVAGIHAAAASKQTFSMPATDGQLLVCATADGGGTFHGVSLTPVIFRWNFLTQSRRFQPWFQARGRADLHHAQVSAGHLDWSRTGHRRRDLRVEFFAAGRRRNSLLHPRQAVDRCGRERRAHFVGFAGRPQSRA